RRRAARVAHGTDKCTQRAEVGMAEVRHRAARRPGTRTQHADAHLHGDRHAYRRAHRGDTRTDEFRLAHQAGTKSTARDPLAGTAAVEIDLIVAGLLAGPRRGGELFRLAAAELQRQRMLLRVEGQQTLAVTAQD